MKIAITDANNFIDLMYIKLLDELFDIERELHITINVVGELNDVQQKTLLKFTKKNRLAIHSQEVFSIPEAIKKSQKLSDSDKLVFSLALQLDAFMLTGDGVIRKVSGIQKIEVHGMLWLFDRFLEKKCITKKKALHQLKVLMVYNKRLPIHECENKMVEWSN